MKSAGERTVGVHHIAQFGLILTDQLVQLAVTGLELRLQVLLLLLPLLAGVSLVQGPYDRHQQSGGLSVPHTEILI